MPFQFIPKSVNPEKIPNGIDSPFDSGFRKGVPEFLYENFLPDYEAKYYLSSLIPLIRLPIGSDSKPLSIIFFEPFHFQLRQPPPTWIQPRDSVPSPERLGDSS